MVRAKKKQKRLDAIKDIPSLPSPSSSSLRRSVRDRHAPAVLDASPIPSPRKKRSIYDTYSPVSPKFSSSGNKRKVDLVKPQIAISFGSNDLDSEAWSSRLRGRAKGKAKMKGKKKMKRKPGREEFQEISDVADQIPIPLSSGEDGSTENEKSVPEIENQENSDLSHNNNTSQNELNHDKSDEMEPLEQNHSMQCENSCPKDQTQNPVEEEPSLAPPEQTEVPSPVACENLNQQPNDESNAVSEVKYKTHEPEMKEGRRCGLCGGGTDGKPPKILIHDLNESDKEAYEGGLTACDESNYDEWDGFGDESGWLGRLLGPIRDRIGIARIWVHQNCAVWSPEVYFAGPGYLKSIRAALYRGRSLKCSRCSRPGATIGCRVDRCPKTYHLPCSRAVGCIFDHCNFLIACNDHRHLFQPRGDEYFLHLKKLKLKKLRADLKKRSTEARKNDLEAEEKWLENCGEDEEFLKRETKRLHRDVLRIAPTFIGGVSENNQIHEGWESVAGLKGVINCMKEVVILPLLYPEVFNSLNLTPPRGVLLHGHPGTGKTLIVRALIGACSRGDKKIAYFARKGADCLGKYVGDAERQLRLLFQVAEKTQPSIIFFDEIDGLAPSRSKQQDQTHNSVVATLLSLMDGLKSRGSVIVIGATNRPDAVDPALRRPGRFDREIYFPLPSKEDRVSILSLHTKKWPHESVSDSIIAFVADRTIGYSGADLQSMCTQAVVNALKRSFPLKEVLLEAERGVFSGGPPALPAVCVEERDWIEALMSAPPPCSRRLAGSVISDVIASPLDTHLVPCLLKPLCLFLVSVCMDERVWLPSCLLKAGIAIKTVLFTELEKNNVKIPPVPFWTSHIYSMVDKQHVKDKLIKILSKFGIISSGIESKEEIEFDVSSDVGYNKLLGFRALIGGVHRSGQQRLASCLLNGFLGGIEIIKVNLATMSLEGNGDIISGLTQILLKCLNMRRCVIYMPRIDLWAINKAQNMVPDTNDDVSADVSRVSEIWSAFVEHADSACTSNSAIILATSEIQFNNLPIAIRNFFNVNTSNSHTIPRFSLDLDGKFNPHEVINSCASKLCHDLIQHYIQLVHQTSHNNNTDPNIRIKFQFPNTTEIETEKENSTPAVEIPEKGEMKINNNNNNNNNNITAGAISSFGYQILVYPQFSELCWVTSKLKEGPFADIKGQWRGWPFSSCIYRTNDTSCTGTKNPSGIIVRGLVAVGLMAYRGVYTSINDVCFEVRKVLELLAKKIQIRVSEKRDPYRYFRVLTQMACLEDMVMNWAYSFKRTYGESRMGEARTEPTIHEIVHVENRAQNDTTQSNEGTNIIPNEAEDNISNDNNPNEVEDNNPNEVEDNNPNEAGDNNPNDNSLDEVEDNNPINAQDNNHNKHEANDNMVPETEFQNEPHESETVRTCTGTLFTSREKDSCIYSCCPDCFRQVNNTVSKAILRFWKNHLDCSIVDDMHDIITTYALNIVTAVTKKHASQSSSEMGEFVPIECESHLMSSGVNSEEKLSFSFRDGVLMPSNVGFDREGVETLHCHFNRLCLSPILDMVTL